MIAWLDLAVRSVLRSAVANSRTLGGAFCASFTVALAVCLWVVYRSGGYQDVLGATGDVADASGVSFAFAITIITLGRITMQALKFWRDPIKAAEERGLKRGVERGLGRGREEGRERTIDGLRQIGVNLTPDQPDLLRADDKEGDKSTSKR